MFGAAQTTVFLGTAKADEARHFYLDVLGLELIRDDQFAVVFKLKGGELALSKIPSVSPQGYTVLDFQVPDLEAAHGLLSARGAVFERFQGMPLDDFASWTTPDGSARIAWFKDPDGHVLSISERR